MLYSELSELIPMSSSCELVDMKLNFENNEFIESIFDTGRALYTSIAKSGPSMTALTSSGIKAPVRSSVNSNCIWLTIDHKLAIDAGFMRLAPATTPVEVPPKTVAVVAKPAASCVIQLSWYKLYPVLHVMHTDVLVLDQNLQLFTFQFTTVRLISF